MRKSALIVALVAALALPACGKKTPPPAPPPPPAAPAVPPPAPPPPPRPEQAVVVDEYVKIKGMTVDEIDRLGLLTEIHFDFDKSDIRTDDAAILDQKIPLLMANRDLRIRISGHCDERGSDEYNLALGNRRATAAKQYLVSRGIDAGRIETASFGEERPIALGHDEDSWWQNRRSEFEILSGGDMLRRP